MVRSVIAANEKAAVRIKPVIGILLHDVATILLVDSDRTAVGKSYLEPESVVIHPRDGDLSHELSQNGPDTGDSSLQEREQGVSPGEASQRR